MTLWRAAIAACLASVVAGCGEDVFPLDEREGETDGGDTDPCSGEHGLTWYVREDGGDWLHCTGLADEPYPGSGYHQQCAFAHPFHVLPPGGDPLMGPGDRLIIAAGSYDMGHGAPGATHPELCDADFSWLCTAPPIPPGKGEEQPTCVLGQGWDGECEDPLVVLSATGGASHVLSLEGSDHVRVQCLEITDGESCIDGHEWLPCPEPPELAESPVGQTGIVAEHAQGVTLEHVRVHGMAADGIRGTAELVDWTLEDVHAMYNGHNGISFDAESEFELVTWGDFDVTRVTSSWNGCIEPPSPEETPEACGQEGGVGLSASLSAAEWWIDESDFSHNTNTGLRIARHESDGETVIDRLRAEGNAGVQLDISGEATVTNSVLVANCEFFALQEPPIDELGSCAAGGYAVQLGMFDGTTVAIVNSTIYGQGEALIAVLAADDEPCEETSIVALNNIYYGAESEIEPVSLPWLIQDSECSETDLELTHGILHGVEGAEELCAVSDNFCESPGFAAPDPGEDPLHLALVPPLESLAIDTGLPNDDEDLIPPHDFLGRPRPIGAGVDRGAFEIEQ